MERRDVLFVPSISSNQHFDRKAARPASGVCMCVCVCVAHIQKMREKERVSEKEREGD